MISGFRDWRIGGVAVVGAVATVVGLSAGAQQRVFRGATNLVLVDVYPQRDGRIVEGLTRDDFEIFENNVPQALEAIEFVRVEPNPPDVVRRDPNSQREALAVAADPYARVFAVLLDTYHTAISGAHAIRRPLLDTLNRLVTPADLFGLITQRERARDLVFGRRLDSIEDQMREHWAWGERHSLDDIGDGILTGLDERDPMEGKLDDCFSQKVTPGGIVPWYVDDGPTRRLYSEVIIERRREDRVITVVEDLVTYLGDVRNGRSVLLVVSDGWLWFPVDRALPEHLMESETQAQARPGVYLGPGARLSARPPEGAAVVDADACNQELIRLANLDNPRRLRTLIDEARRRSVTIYPINPDGLTPDNQPASDRTKPNADARPGDVEARHRQRVSDRIEQLRELAEGTDGFAIVNSNDLAGGLGRIAEDVSAYYLLGYASTNTEGGGQYRTIRVNVRQPDLHVRHRRGYRGSSAAPVAGPEVGPPAEEVETKRALDDAFGRLARLRRDAPLFTAGVMAAGEAVVVVELSPAEALAAKATTSVIVSLLGVEGTVVETAEAEIATATRGVLLRVPIPAGASGPWRANVVAGTGSSRRQDSVEIGTDAHTLAGPGVLYRATPSPRSPLIPVADQLFRRTERVHVEWARLTEVDRREVRLLGRDGNALPIPVALTEREAGGRAAFAADLNLAPLTEGEYAIELTVGSGGVTERRIVAIRVTR